MSKKLSIILTVALAVALVLTSSAYALTTSNPVTGREDTTNSPSADLDGDGDVDYDDFFKFVDNFGTSGGNADLNNDGIVNFNDFFLFADNFGSPRNSAPVISNILGSREVLEGQTVTLQVQASDAENNPLSYSINSDKFAKNTNTFTWRTNYQSEGTHKFLLSVTDSFNTVSQEITIRVSHSEEPRKTADFNNDGEVDYDDFFLFADQFGSDIGIYDLNNDGKVDYDDFFRFADSFGEIVSQPPLGEPTTADLNGDGVVNFADFEIFQATGGADLNGDGKVDYDDFFLFVDRFGEVVQIPDTIQPLRNPDPRDNTEGVNSRLRTFSFDSLVAPGSQVTYEFYLIKGSNWRDNSANTAALNDIKDISNNAPVRVFTSSNSRPSLTLENLHDLTVYYWRIKATDSNGNSYVGPVWKFFTHTASSLSGNEFVPSITNQKPTANILNPVSAGQTYTAGKGAFILFKGAGNDVDGTIVSYEWLIPGITHLKGSDKKEIIVDLQNTPGNYKVQFRVQDDKEEWSDWIEFNLVILDKFAPNRPSNPDPADGSNPQFSPIFQPYGGLGFSARGGDRDSTSGSYRIQISHTPDMSQIFEDELIVIDNYFQTSNPNIGLSTPNFRQGNNFWWRIIATDSDGLTTYSPVWTFGPGVAPLAPLQIPPPSDGGVFVPPSGGPAPSPPPPSPGPGPSPSPPPSPGPGPSPPPGPLGNVAPVLIVTDKNVNEGQLLTFLVTATDANGDALTFGASNLPSGSLFVGQTFSWTPTFTQSGSYSVTFTASDGKGGVDTKAITITVNNVNQGPILNSIQNIRVNEGETVVVLAIATDIDNDPITYSISDSRFKQESPGRFVWNTWFEDSGAFTLTVRASTPDGKFDTKTVRIDIDNTKVDHPRLKVAEAFVLNEGSVEDVLELYINVLNNGNTDNQDTTVTVSIPELDIYEQLGVFNLDSGSRYSDVVEISLDGAVSGKEYYYIVKVESSKTSDIKFGSFIVG